VRRLYAALLLLICLGAALASVVRIRTDLSELLPEGTTPTAAFLSRQMREGPVTTLLMAGIEGAPPAELARIARETAASLRDSGQFAFVGAGNIDLPEAEQELIFRYRYLLSNQVTPETFTSSALHEKLEGLLDGLRSAASPLVVRFGFADPTGEFFSIARAWLAETEVDAREGAWFARGATPPRALIIARINGAGGLNTDAQANAIATIRQAFIATNPGNARLLLSGAGVFAAEVERATRADVETLSVASALLLAIFLWWRYHSLTLIALAAVPLGAGAIAGLATCALLFGGTVHAIAIGFGMTMMGVTVDYAILLVTLRRANETLADTAHRIWPTLRLAAASATAGLAAMLGSGFPGLMQLGVFAAAGLLVAAATTAWILPWLLPDAHITARPLPGWLLRALGMLRGRRRLASAILLASLGLLFIGGGPKLQRDIGALSPLPSEAQALDAELRRQLGAPDTRIVFALGPGSEAEILSLSERLTNALAPITGQGRPLEGVDAPSLYLPSPATQEARRTSLPSILALAAALTEAQKGLPFRENAFAPFLAAVAESHHLAPLDFATFSAGAPILSARLAPLLYANGGLALARGVPDQDALAKAVADIGEPRILLIDIKAETEAMLMSYAGATLFWALMGGILVFILLLIGLRGARLALDVAAPIGGAILVTLAALMIMGQTLSLFHLASLLLLVGLAMDYALFVARSDNDPEATSDDTIGAVLNCAISTLLTFGLLALCSTPVLRGIGLTVSIGVISAFLLALAMSRRSATHG